MSMPDATALPRGGQPHPVKLATGPATAEDRTLPASVTWLAERRRRAVVGDEVATRKRHDRGRLTARERVLLLLDEGTFMETDLFARHRATGF
ncbi:MAG TPA: carboxyl transferase domain-containing protein, partial [Actinomycetales bacterium]|nr:carboxyl transferase domain-containing protein [Actinomycetales bacterium]